MELKISYKFSHLTETALLSMKKKTHLMPSRDEATVVVLLDQSVVFDRIDCTTLLDYTQNVCNKNDK